MSKKAQRLQPQSSSFLSRFQRYRSTITGKSAFSILPLSVFLYFFPNFPSHFYILSNLVYLSGSVPSSWSLSLFFVCNIFLRILSSPKPS